MKHLNNKGFAVSTILYGILALTILILMLIFAIMKSNKDMNEDLVESLTESINTCATLEARFESCYFSNNNCDYIADLYNECIKNKKDNSNLLAYRILANNAGGQSDTNIDFSKTSDQDGTKGLYYTSTNTEDNKTTYYFRGDVTNNYVKFAGFYWRIIRINEDGSVRLIYQGTSSDSTGTDSRIGTSAFNENDNDNAYAGYMYGLPESTTLYGDIDADKEITMQDAVAISHFIQGTGTLTEEQKLLSDVNFDSNINEDDLEIITSIITGEHTYDLSNYSSEGRYNSTHSNVQDSIIKNKLDSWYKTNLKTDYSNYLADAGFCNDRSVSNVAKKWHYSDTTLGYGTNATYYGAYHRLRNEYQPQFACPNASNDLFTTSTSSKGNKALDYPIGLITADEVAYAGMVYGQSVSENYLYAGDLLNWTMSPCDYDGDPFMIFYMGAELRFYTSVGVRGVRPVINLKKDVKVTDISQNGTIGNEYEIKLGE